MIIALPAIFLREDFNKKNSKKSDIVTIRSGTYLPYLNSDIKISDICLKILYRVSQKQAYMAYKSRLNIELKFIE